MTDTLHELTISVNEQWCVMDFTNGEPVGVVSFFGRAIFKRISHKPLKCLVNSLPLPPEFSD